MGFLCRTAILIYSLVLLLSLSSWKSTCAEETGAKPKNLSIHLPKIFDWTRYKTGFQKIYPTIRDELARKKLFIASALKTFVHNMAFRLGKVRYYLSINQFSDSTPEEVHKMYSGFRPSEQEEGESKSSSDGQSVEMGPLTGVDLNRLEQMLAQIVEEKQPGYRLLAQQLQITIDHHRSKREVGISEQIDAEEDGMKLRSDKTKKSGLQQVFKSDRLYDSKERHNEMIIDEFRSPLDGEQPNESDKFVRRVPSTNPEHAPLKLIGQAANTVGNEDALPEEQLYFLEIIPSSVNYVKRQISWLADTFKKIASEDDNNGNDDEDPADDCFREGQPQATCDGKKVNIIGCAWKKSYESSTRARLGYLSDVSNGSRIEDQVYVDYRKDGCLTVPRDQSHCASCYAFVIAALMEWWHCSQTGHLVPFSEQYIIDCGRHVDMHGCSGGNTRSMERFVRDWGVELLADYPYLVRESVCPYEKHDWHRAGYKRPVVLNYDKVNHRAFWPAVLKMSGPALAIIKIPEDFSGYGGLVHPGHNCDRGEGYHAMLLVGHGAEDGEEYWLFRNSNGHHWGEQGYFKLSKGAKDDCFQEAYDTTFDFLRPPVQPIEVTESFGMIKVIKKLTPYEAHHRGLLRYK